jgi:hypothetical protein
MSPTAEDEILERASLTRELLTDLVLVSRIVDGASRAWEVNQSAPGSNAQKVQSIFRADEDGAPGDAHVYVVPTDDGLFARYTINRHDGGSMREFMSGEAFLDEVAAEMMSLAVAKGILEECPDEDCGGVNPADATECSVCGQKLGEEEEPEAVVEPANGQAARATTPVPAPPALTVDEAEFMKP